MMKLSTKVVAWIWIGFWIALMAFALIGNQRSSHNTVVPGLSVLGIITGWGLLRRRRDAWWGIVCYCCVEGVWIGFIVWISNHWAGIGVALLHGGIVATLLMDPPRRWMRRGSEPAGQGAPVQEEKAPSTVTTEIPQGPESVSERQTTDSTPSGY